MFNDIIGLEKNFTQVTAHPNLESLFAHPLLKRFQSFAPLPLPLSPKITPCKTRSVWQNNRTDSGNDQCRERFPSKNGLGFKIWDSYGHYRMDEVFMYMIVLGLLGLAIDRTFRYVVEERMLKWRVGLTQ